MTPIEELAAEICWEIHEGRCKAPACSLWKASMQALRKQRDEIEKDIHYDFIQILKRLQQDKEEASASSDVSFSETSHKQDDSIDVVGNQMIPSATDIRADVDTVKESSSPETKDVCKGCDNIAEKCKFVGGQCCETKDCTHRGCCPECSHKPETGNICKHGHNIVVFQVGEPELRCQNCKQKFSIYFFLDKQEQAARADERAKMDNLSEKLHWDNEANEMLSKIQNDILAVRIMLNNVKGIPFDDGYQKGRQDKTKEIANGDALRFQDGYQKALNDILEWDKNDADPFHNRKCAEGKCALANHIKALQGGKELKE